MRLCGLYLVIFLCSFAGSVEERTDNPRMVRFFRGFISLLTGKSLNTGGLKKAATEGRIQQRVPDSVPFPCDTRNARSAERPSSVHRLRPGDIDVIGSIGDSLSAGSGLVASNLLHIAVENRGVSWVIGGRGTWREFLTLPNILKEFNQNLVGYAQEDASAFQRNAQFSVAEPGAMSRDMPYAAKLLVRRMKSDPRVDFQNDWKLINFFIGGNDFCVDVCYLPKDEITKSAEFHRQDLIRTFDYLRDNSPRTLVNFILAPRTQIGTTLVGRPTTCILTNLFECPCLFGEAHKKIYSQMQKIEQSWIEVEKEVGNSERYRTKKDFALVVQPFVPGSRIPKLPSGKTDLTYISTDCFHFSQKGGARATNALWNNLLQPPNNKSLRWTPLFETFLCPTEENPYIATWTLDPRSNALR